MEDRIARQEEEILSGSLSHMFKIIEPEEEHKMSTDDDKARDINIGMLRQELSGLMGHLYGPEGKGGTLDRLEKGQAAVLDGIESLKTSFSDLTNMHMRDVLELDKKIIQNTDHLDTYIKKNTEIEKKIDGHINTEKIAEESRRKKWGARLWDVGKTVFFLSMGALAAKYLGV